MNFIRISLEKIIRNLQIILNIYKLANLASLKFSVCSIFVRYRRLLQRICFNYKINQDFPVRGTVPALSTHTQLGRNLIPGRHVCHGRDWFCLAYSAQRSSERNRGKIWMKNWKYSVWSAAVAAAAAESTPRGHRAPVQSPWDLLFLEQTSTTVCVYWCHKLERPCTWQCGGGCRNG